MSLYTSICEKDICVLGDCNFYMVLLRGVKNANLILDYININAEWGIVWSQCNLRPKKQLG